MDAVCDVDALLADHIGAYNRHDVAAFVQTFAPAAEIYEHPNQLVLKGREDIATHYTALFARAPGLTVTVKHRTHMENHIVDEEALSLNGEAVEGGVAVYRIEGCLIQRVDQID